MNVVKRPPIKKLVMNCKIENTSDPMCEIENINAHNNMIIFSDNTKVVMIRLMNSLNNNSSIRPIKII